MNRSCRQASVIACGCVVWLPVRAQTQVRAWEDSLTLPTYREGPASPAATFAAWTSGVANYPYAARRNFAKQREPHSWRSLNLENEYLFCRVLPDLGGHLYGCRDKRNGREMFYANPVVKPGDIGLRGAWNAIGIESNFPIGHSRDTASPVDFALRQDPDGSARAMVEDIDRVSGMQWRVEFILRPGDTVLEQRVTLYNRSTVRRPFSWWANADIAFDDAGMRLVMPARVVSTHTTPAEIVAWPVSIDGKDGTLVANHRVAAAWFDYHSGEPFFAVYKPASRSGLAHFADPNTMPGKKIWVWGAEQDAWVRSALTDGFSSYVEMQAGLFQNQETFQFLEPEQTRSFSELWIPVFDVSGITSVSPHAVLSIARTSGSNLVVELSATHSVPGAAIRISLAGKAVYETHADLTPNTTYRHTLENALSSSYTIDVADARQSVLLSYTENHFDGLTPDKAPLGKVTDAPSSGDTEAMFLERGTQHELFSERSAALTEYARGMHLFPASMALKKAAGRLALGLNRFDEAVNFLFIAAAGETDDEAVYLLGTAQAAAGRDVEAAETLLRLDSNSAFHRAATLQLVRVVARGHDDRRALELLQPLLSDPAGINQGAALQVALLRRSGRAEDAKAALRKWQSADPADPFLRYESTLLGASAEGLWTHLAVDSQRILDLAQEYLELGMDRDALAVLTHEYPPIAASEVEPGALPAALNPMLSYYRAYIGKRLGQDPSADLLAAAGGITHYVFPYRPSSFAVLTADSRLNPSDAFAHLLLGRLLLHCLFIDPAIAEFERAVSLNPKLPEVNFDLAKTLLENRKDAAGALAVARQGLRLDPTSPELLDLVQHAGEALVSAPPTPPSATSSSAPAPSTKDPALALKSPTTALASGAAMDKPRDTASAALVQAAAGRAAEAAAMFDPRVFRTSKQPDLVRAAYIEVQLHLVNATAKAGKCTEAMDQLFRLGGENTSLEFTSFGFEGFMKAAHFQYYKAGIEALCHDDKAARKRWMKVSKMSAPIASPEFAYSILAAWKLDPEQAKPRIAAALDQTRKALAQADATSKPEFEFLEAALLRASGQVAVAVDRLQGLVRNSEDPWLRYLALVEVQQAFSSIN